MIFDEKRLSTSKPIVFPISAELSQTDVKPLPEAFPHEIDGELCWAVRLFDLEGLMGLVDRAGGSLEFTNHIFSVTSIVIRGIIEDE